MLVRSKKSRRVRSTNRKLIMGNNPFISHRMFVAALNNDHQRLAPSDNGAPVACAAEAGAAASPRHLTEEQFASFAAYTWSEFPMRHGLATSAS